MINKKSFIAIIPARGGSKRLPRKNVLDFAGKPLIVWTIESALKCKYIDKVVVTSDDEEILKIAKSYGAVAIRRPINLALDTSNSFEAIRHVLENFENFDYTVLLQPTSPLRNSQHINEAIMLLENKSADAIISVTGMEHSPEWSNTLPIDDNMIGFIRQDLLNKRSQELEVYYRLNGAIYICNTDKLLKNHSFFLDKSIFAYKMSNYSSVDIDEELDFKWAEFLYGNQVFKKS